MLTRQVDGVEVVLSDDEEVALRAEWAAEEARRAAEAPARQIAALERAQELTAAELREFILAVGGALPQVKSSEAYAKVVALEAQIAPIKAKI